MPTGNDDVGKAGAAEGWRWRWWLGGTMWAWKPHVEVVVVVVDGEGVVVVVAVAAVEGWSGGGMSHGFAPIDLDVGVGGAMNGADPKPMAPMEPIVANGIVGGAMYM